VTPQQLAMMQKDPQFAEGMKNGVADFNATSAAQRPAFSAPTNLQPSGRPGYMPSYQNLIGGMISDLYVPGSGAKVLESNLPTEQMKNDQWAGITPQQRSAIANQIELKPNNTYATRGPDGRPNLQFVAADPDSNAQYSVDAGGNITAAGIQGLPQAHADLAAIKQASINKVTAAPTNLSPVDSQGRTIPTTIADALGSRQGVGNSPAQLTLDKQNEAAAAQNQELPNQIPQTKQTILGLQNALTLMNKLSATGPGTVKANELWSALGNSIPGLQPGDDKNNYQLVTKYLNNALTAASQATGANTSNAKMEQLEHGQPDAGLLNLAPLKEATQYVLSQNDAALDRAQFVTAAAKTFAQSGARNPDALAQQAWSNSYKDRAPLYEFNRIPAQEQAA